MNLTNYLIARTPDLPPASSNSLYDYILAGNGLFLRAKRPGFQVTAQLAVANVNGLSGQSPQFQLDYPKVPAPLLQQMLLLARREAPQEILFHLFWDNERWHLDLPPQKASATRVQRLTSGFDSSYYRTLIEVHSHHNMNADFSLEDDRDESGLRIFGVLGTIFSSPTLRLRVGIYHQLFWDVPYSWVFESVEGILDGAALC